MNGLEIMLILLDSIAPVAAGWRDCAECVKLKIDKWSGVARR